MSTSVRSPLRAAAIGRTGRRRLIGIGAVVAAAAAGLAIVVAYRSPLPLTAPAGDSARAAAPAGQGAQPPAPAGQNGDLPVSGPAGTQSSPGGPAVAFGYQPLWPFAGPADAAAWQQAYRSGGQQPWHLDAAATALGFTRGYLGYTGVDRVGRSDVDGREAYVAVGFRLPDGALQTAAHVHLVRLGTGSDAPWEVVGTRDTSLRLTTPAYGASVSSPMTVGGRITGVDENLTVHVHRLGQQAPVGRTAGIPAGGQWMPWTARLQFSAQPGAVLTVAVATGGHVATVERFAITGVRAAAPGPARPAIDGDVDGDGRVDSITLPATGALQIRYATGTSETVAFDASQASPTAGVRVLGVIDSDRDGRAEVFVRAGSGASVDFATVFRYVDGRLRLVTAGGQQAMLGYGASARNAVTWACRPPAAPIVTWSGQSDDGVTYRGTQQSYRFAGATLVRTGSRPLTVIPDRPAPSGCGSIRL